MSSGDLTDNLVVFSGSAHEQLGRDICQHLGVPLSPIKVERFANDCMQVQLLANCRRRDVYLIQPIVKPAQENLVELLFMISAAKGASAASITVVLPHYAYARSDKKDAPRIAIGGRLVADLLVAAGATRVLAMTLHSPQVHGFFGIPVDHLHALFEMADHFRQYDQSRTTVVSPDLGNAKEAAALARLLGTAVAAGAKQRFPNDEVVITSIIGDVAGRDIIILDDEIAKGSTVLELLTKLEEAGARSVRVACTHGLFADGAIERIASRKGVVEIVCTDTVPIDAAELRAFGDRLKVLTVAPALAEAIRRIHAAESVSSLFDATTARG